MSQKVRIVYKNLWRDGSIYAYTSEHPQFPVENTQDDDKSLIWRSRYGTGSGNGNFITSAGAYAGPDLVTNGGFSVNTEGWTSDFGSLASLGGGQSGNCLSILRVTGAYQNAKQNISGLTVGSIYALTGYVKSGTSGNEAGFIQFDMGGDNYFRKWFTSSDTWTAYTLIFKAGATSGTLELNKFTATPGIMYFDTIVMALYAGTNIFINFDEGGAELEGVVATGTYNGNTLATAIAAAMNTAPGKALTYTCTYSETTSKFTIAAGSNFTIRWKMGSKSGADISDICGFSEAADDTGASTYTSDYMRIHIYEFIQLDIGSTYDYDFFALMNHNLQSTATIKIEGADSSDFATGLVSDTITYYGNNIFAFLPSMRSKRYLQLSIWDISNPSGYIQVGTPVVGKYIEFARYILPDGYAKGNEDPTLIDFSDSQNLFADEKPTLFKHPYPFKGLSNTDASNIDLMQKECGYHKGIIVCTDPDNPNTKSEWVTLAELNEVEYESQNYWNWTMPVREHK